MRLSAAPSGQRGLTGRELEVLALVMHGNTNREIAELLRVSPATVRKHLENVFAKLGVHTRTAAVARLLGVSADDDAIESAQGAAWAHRTAGP
jgi:DNA-binding CsgD family transcriptional regulator